MVEALVDHGTYAVGSSRIDLLVAPEDTFPHEGRLLPAKQPGQFTLGAAAYWACSRLGLTYERNYFLAASLVTWLTASLLSAAAGSLLLLLVTGLWGFSRFEGWFTALACGVATILLPYSGISHHDIIAASWLVVALYLLERSVLLHPHGRVFIPFLGGTCIGAALSTSMLPMAIVLALLAGVAATRAIRLIVATGAGVLVGLVPLFAYNTHHFGGPLVQANLAGRYDDTYPGLDAARFLEHLNVYLGAGDVSVIKYMPVVLVAACGIPLLGSRLARQRMLLCGAIAAHLLYVLSVPAIGYCQYGPRFLIPMVPLAMLGLPGVLAWARQGASRRPILVGTVAATVYSLAVNLVGALGGTMYCDTRTFAFPRYLGALGSVRPHQFPLAAACAILAALGALAWACRGFRLRAGRSGPRRPGS